MASRMRRGIEFWREQSRLWKISGLTQSAFCQQNGLALQTFTRWNSLFKTEAGEGTQVAGGAEPVTAIPKLVPVVFTTGGEHAGGMAADRGSIAIRLDGCPWTIEVAPNFEAAHLQRLLAALKAPR